MPQQSLTLHAQVDHSNTIQWCWFSGTTSVTIAQFTQTVAVDIGGAITGAEVFLPFSKGSQADVLTVGGTRLILCMLMSSDAVPRCCVTKCVHGVGYRGWG